MLLAMRVILTAHAGPVIERIPQTRVAPSPHDHHLSRAAPASDRGRAGITADGMVISFSERLRGLREHRGADYPTHSWQGKQDFHVTMLDYLLVFAHFLQQQLYASRDLCSLPVEQAQNRKDQQCMLAGGLGGAGRKLQRGHAQPLVDLIAI